MTTDKEIEKDREGKYGPPLKFFRVYQEMCKLLTEYSELSKHDKPDGHLEVLRFVLLKVLRSSWNPGVEDNYCDARNYINFAERFTKTERERP